MFRIVENRWRISLATDFEDFNTENGNNTPGFLSTFPRLADNRRSQGKEDTSKEDTFDQSS
jgi:hypothetical protein